MPPQPQQSNVPPQGMHMQDHPFGDMSMQDSEGPRSGSRGRRSRSRSRGTRDHKSKEYPRRSRSREANPIEGRPREQQRRSRSREGYPMERREAPAKGSGRGGEAAAASGPPMETRTILITQGDVGTRIALKKVMETFGRVDVCHTGNRQNPQAEPPWVRFALTSSAETALAAMNTGQVLLDGQVLRAEVKRGGRPGPAPRPAWDRGGRDMEATSRDFAQDLARRRRSPSSPRRRRR